jgi:hypothetical protein
MYVSVGELRVKICPKMFKEAIKYFKDTGIVTPHFLMRKFKIDHLYALKICLEVAEKFPNLWKDRHKNFMERLRAR